MTGTRDEIKRLYQMLSADRRGGIIDQVDDLADALRLYLKADLCALFVRGERNTSQPISICYGPDRTLTELTRLRDYWVEGGALEETGEEEDSECEPDPFAVANGFSESAVYNFRDHRQREVVAVIYWVNHADQSVAKDDQIVQLLLRLVVRSLASVDPDSRSFDVTDQLCHMVGLFEADHTRVPFTDLIERLLDVASGFLDGCRASLLVRKGRTEPFELHNGSPKDDPIQGALERAIAAVTDRFSRLPAPELASWSELLNDEASESIIAGLILDEPNLQYILVLQRPGMERLDEMKAQVISLYYHSVCSILGNARSVQKLRRAHRALQKSSSLLAEQEAMAAVSDMTSGVAHDFNNIIGGIVGRIQLMRMKADDSRLLHDLEKIERLALEGAETVKHIQEFSTRTRYKRPERVDLKEIIQTTVASDRADWYPVAEEKNLSIVTDLPEDTAIAFGNGPDLIAAFDHLLENAVEHSPEGSRIRVSLSPLKDYYRLAVQDSGPGVDEDCRAKLFYPFYSTKEERGAGLGLSIVYGTAVRHGGRAGFEPAPGGGALFYMDLEYPKDLTQDETTTQVVADTGRLTVLVVDDDNLIREILTDMLTIDGHETVACEDGFRALEAMEGHDFDLVITDLGMPGMSGLELADTIHQSRPELPIAMITGWGTQLNHDEIKSKGIKKLLAKPFHLKDIKKIVSDLVSGSGQPV